MTCRARPCFRSYTLEDNIIHCNTMCNNYNTIYYNTVQYNIIQYNTTIVQYNIAPGMHPTCRDIHISRTKYRPDGRQSTETSRAERLAEYC